VTLKIVTIGFRGRALLRGAAIAAILAWSVSATAQSLVVAGTSYASPAEYLVGTWQWLREKPQQLMQMHFARNGDFFFNNLTAELIHYGKFEATKDSIRLTITRTCEKGKCRSPNPPALHNYPLRPLEPNVMYSADEKWNRLSSE
jgi:hypothetical protein